MRALALDRQAIEKKDFPISRRGYEPEAVDLHLTSLSEQVARLQSDLERVQRAATAPGASSRPAPAPAQPSRTQSLALVASEQVRMIVEAAETSATDIERSAEEEAARIRADADTEARRTRDEAVARAEDHVGEVGGATSAMLQRVDAMENELGALLESLRTGTNRLTADLSLLQGNLGDLYGAAGSTQAPAPPRAYAAAAPASAEADAALVEAYDEPEPYAPIDAEPEPLADEESAPLAEEPELVDEPVAAAPAPPAAEDEPPAAVSPPEPPDPAERRRDDGDVEGARLIALNMALNGQSREETDTYLRDNFDLDDRDALLDEVYANVEG